jgi:hypothetical protein
MGPSSHTAVVLTLALLFATVGRADVRLVVLGHKVWRVDPEGQIRPFWCEFRGPQTGGEFGSTYPLPSPDDHWIVFARDHDLHLLDVASGHERRITKFGRPHGVCCASVETLINTWSSDSRRLLLPVSPGETSGPAEEWDHDLLVCKAPYGVYTYDLTTGTTQALALPKDFQFQAWLPDGSFLGTIAQPKPCEGGLQIFRPGEARGRAVGPRGDSPGQVQVSGEGKWAVVYMGVCAAPAKSVGAEILKIDLATGSATTLMPASSWAENQWPAFSPHGGHFSYIHQKRLAEHVFEESLIVDSRRLYSCHEYIDYKWIGDRRVALKCGNEVLVLDIATRHPLSRYSVSALAENWSSDPSLR